MIPKAEVDKIYDLSDEDYTAVMATVKMLAKHFEEVLGERTMIKVVGTDVPHAHVHVLPVNENWAGGAAACDDAGRNGRDGEEAAG